MWLIAAAIGSSGWLGRCKQFRRLATRYEMRAEQFRPMWVVVATLLWL